MHDPWLHCGGLINKFNLLHRYLLSLQFEELFLLLSNFTNDGSFQQQIARPSQEEKVEEKEEDKAEKTEKKEEEKKDEEEKDEKEDSK